MEQTLRATSLQKESTSFQRNMQCLSKEIGDYKCNHYLDKIGRKENFCINLYVFIVIPYPEKVE